MTVYNIKCSNGQLTGKLENGQNVIGFYRITQHDEVQLLDLVVERALNDPLADDSHKYYDLTPAEVDFAELEDVIGMRLGYFATTMARSYKGLI